MPVGLRQTRRICRSKQCGANGSVCPLHGDVTIHSTVSIIAWNVGHSICGNKWPVEQVCVFIPSSMNVHYTCIENARET